MMVEIDLDNPIKNKRDIAVALNLLASKDYILATSNNKNSGKFNRKDKINNNSNNKHR